MSIRLWAVHTELTPADAADRLALCELFDAYAHCADHRDAGYAIRKDEWSPT